MRLIISFVFLFTSLPVFAVKGIADFGLNQPFVGARALGMGNAYTAATDDHNAIFYNPAALARNENWKVRLFISPTLDLDILDFVDDANEALDVSDTQKNTAVTDLLDKYGGEFYHARLIGPSAIWTKKNWGVAFIPLNFQVNTQINEVTGYELKLDGHLDTTLAVSYANDVDWFGADHWISYGATLKAVNRASVVEVVNSTDLAQRDDFFDLKKDSYEGLTFDIDIGLLWTPKISQSSFLRYTEPTFALSIKNILDYGYPIQLGLISDNDSDEPVKLGRRVDLGSSWQLPSFWVFNTRFALDIRDMGHENWTFNKSHHAGVEFHWEMYKWWQGHWSIGLNQGYLTAGFGGKLGWFQLDLSTWGEEVGTKDDRREDRRYIAEFSIDF